MTDGFTNDRTKDCEIRTVYAIDVHTAEDLASDPISLITKLGDLGYGPQKCAMLTLTVAALRAKAGKPKLNTSIGPSNTIQDIIDEVC